MERIVKERLVGAAVLMAAAIILIPEMLSGPDRESHAEQPAQARSDAPIKTYTIDLSQSPSAQPTPGVIENRAPPAETVVVPEPLDQARGPQPAASDQAKPEDTQPSPQQQSMPPQSEQARVVREEPAEPVVEPPTARATPPVTATAAPRPTARPLASGSDAPTSGRWAVQVGSYSKQATAERLAKQLRDQGQSAFVMPVKSGGATLYRVRIGPLQDRASAEAVLRDVKSSTPGAAIVAHP